MIKARPVAGDLDAGERFLERSAALRLAQNPRLRRDPGHPFDQAPDPRPSRRRRDRGGRPQHQARPRRHPRDRVLRPDPAADLGRPRPGAARLARPCRRAGGAGRRAAGSSATVADELTAAYRFLRTVEHRLQMIDDEQTQTLPDDDAGLRHLAPSSAIADAQAFSDAHCSRQLQPVERHYAALFEEAPTLGRPRQSRLHRRRGRSRHAARRCAAWASRDPATVAALVRGWHHGRYRATRSARARELLTELMPALLDGARRDRPIPTRRFLRFDHFLARLPAGVQLFSLFHANPQSARSWSPRSWAGAAPGRAAERASRPARRRARRRASRASLPDADDYARRARTRTGAGARFRGRARHRAPLGSRAQFQIGVQAAARPAIDAERAGGRLPTSPTACIGAAARASRPSSRASMAAFAGGGSRVVALGKLGGREMTATSDLDLIFVYDVPADATIRRRASRCRRRTTIMPARASASSTPSPR